MAIAVPCGAAFSLEGGERVRCSGTCWRYSTLWSRTAAHRGLSILSAVIAHCAVVAFHDVRQVSRSPQKPCGCRHLQSPSSVIGVVASHLSLCSECCLMKSPSSMPSFSAEAEEDLCVRAISASSVGAALQLIGVAVYLPRSSHGRHRRHRTCQPVSTGADTPGFFCRLRRSC